MGGMFKRVAEKVADKMLGAAPTRETDVETADRELRDLVAEQHRKPETGDTAKFRVVAPTPGPGCFERLAERAGFAGVAVATLAAAAVGQVRR